MKAFFAICSTIFIALVLSVTPLPVWANWLRPEFTLLVLLYWAIALPETCGVALAGIVGLIQDSLSAQALGTHVLCFAVVIGLVQYAYKSLRLYDPWHQAGFIFLFIGLARLLEHWLSLAADFPNQGLDFLLPSLISSLIWPWLLIALRNFRRKVGLIQQL